MSVTRKFNHEKHGIELYFDKKPSSRILGLLKSNEWHWNPKKQCWYKKDYKTTREFSAALCAEVNGTAKKQAPVRNNKVTAPHQTTPGSKLSDSSTSKPGTEGPSSLASTPVIKPEPAVDRPAASAHKDTSSWSKRLFSVMLIILIVIVGVYGVKRYRAHKEYQENKAYFTREYKKDLKSYTKMDKDNHVYMSYIKKQYRNGTLRQKVTYYNEMLTYEHLGENIYDSLTYNGHEIFDGDVIRVRDGEHMQYTITEEDSIPDSATADLSMGHIKKDYYLYGFWFQGKITVREVGGTRYPGAYATFKYKVNIDPYVNKKKFRRYAVRKLQSSYENINKEYHIY